MLVKVVLTIISSKVRAADNTASRLFYHFTSLSLSLNHHHPLLIIVISIHSSNPPSLSLHLSLWTVPSIVCFLSLFLFFFFLFNLCQICSAVHQLLLLLMMMMILPCCLSIFGSLSSLLLGWFCIFLS